MNSCSRRALSAYYVPGTVLDPEEPWTRLDVQAASVSKYIFEYLPYNQPYSMY